MDQIKKKWLKKSCLQGIVSVATFYVSIAALDTFSNVEKLSIDSIVEQYSNALLNPYYALASLALGLFIGYDGYTSRLAHSDQLLALERIKATKRKNKRKT